MSAFDDSFLQLGPEDSLNMAQAIQDEGSSIVDLFKRAQLYIQANAYQCALDTLDLILIRLFENDKLSEASFFLAWKKKIIIYMRQGKMIQADEWTNQCIEALKKNNRFIGIHFPLRTYFLCQAIYFLLMSGSLDREITHAEKMKTIGYIEQLFSLYTNEFDQLTHCLSDPDILDQWQKVTLNACLMAFRKNRNKPVDQAFSDLESMFQGIKNDFKTP